MKCNPYESLNHWFNSVWPTRHNMTVEDVHITDINQKWDGNVLSVLKLLYELTLLSQRFYRHHYNFPIYIMLQQ